MFFNTWDFGKRRNNTQIKFIDIVLQNWAHIGNSNLIINYI